ncbi:hypothetical protein HKX48_000451 [Thoreauomyces humboldtii]|nr:hypothetical protein HKX48_000451 [Thoreauomyces humboldtii]
MTKRKASVELEDMLAKQHRENGELDPDSDTTDIIEGEEDPKHIQVVKQVKTSTTMSETHTDENSVGSTKIQRTETVTQSTMVCKIEAPAVHPFFAKRTAADIVVTGLVAAVKWSNIGSILTATYQSQCGSAKIAGFDFDGTISCAKGVHAKDASDWRFFHPSIPDRFISLHKEGFRIVFFSNQKGVNDSNQGKRKASFMGRIENIINAIKKHAEKVGEAPPPILVLAATGDDWNRKPRAGMWEVFARDCNDGVRPDLQASFYVGDAAGRAAGHKQNVKKDFADTDNKFALNVGCSFYTPEAFFAHSTTETLITAVKPTGHHSHHAPPPPFLPRNFLNAQRLKAASTDAGDRSYTRAGQEMIVVVGSPASGKSSFVKTHFLPYGYAHINQDTLKTLAKCLSMAKTALEVGQSVVIDNTNPTVEVRKQYIQLAAKVAKDKARSIPVRCIHMTAEEPLCRHNNVFRTYVQNRNAYGQWDESVKLAKGGRATDGPPPVGLLPTIAFRMFASKFAPPTLAEGFDEIVEVDFVPRFENSVDEMIWGSHLS